MNGVWNQLVVAALTIASGPVCWGLLQWWLGRKGEKARAAREQQADEKATKQAEIDRANLLADAQAVAQKTALDSAHDAYEQVASRCDKCLTELEKMQRRDRRRDRIEDAMLDAMVEVVPLLPAAASETAALRAAIHTARRERYELDEELDG